MRSKRLTILQPKRARAGKNAVDGDAQRGVVVQLATPRGSIFRGRVSAAEFAPASGVVQLQAEGVTYFSLVQTAEVALRIGKRMRYFLAVNASVGIEDGRLTVVAEVIQRSLPPVMNCANPDCICRDAYPSIPASRSEKMRSV